MGAVIILALFILTPLAVEYFGSPLLCWGVSICIIAYETWALTLRKGPDEIAEEKKRIEEARRRVEQIKEEAARSFLQGAKGRSVPVAAKDVNSMTEEELAIAARKIVQDLRRKKGRGDGEEAETRNAA